MPKGGLGLVWKWRNSTAKMWRVASAGLLLWATHRRLPTSQEKYKFLLFQQSKKSFCHHCLNGLNIYQQGLQRNSPLRLFISTLRVSLRRAAAHAGYKTLG